MLFISFLLLAVVSQVMGAPFCEPNPRGRLFGKELNTSQIRRFAFLFSVMDKNTNGLFSWRDAMILDDNISNVAGFDKNSNGAYLSQRAQKTLLAYLNQSMGGRKWNLEDFMDAAALLIQAERVVSHQAELYFAIADKNNDGNVTRAEVKTATLLHTGLAEPILTSWADRIFDTLSENDHVLVDLSQFKKEFVRYIYSTASNVLEHDVFNFMTTNFQCRGH